MSPLELQVVDQVLREHRIRAYDCSCGAQINNHDLHLVTVAVQAALLAGGTP